MKTIAFVLLTAFFWVPKSMGQNNDIKGLLDSKETRSEIFNTIMNDHELMMEFMDAMKHNRHAMMMMQGDSSMMGNGSMHRDSTMMHGSPSMMQDNSSMMGNESMHRDSTMMHMNMQHQMEGNMTENPGMMHQMMMEEDKSSDIKEHNPYK